jgi:hypothetical protein
MLADWTRSGSRKNSKRITELARLALVVVALLAAATASEDPLSNSRRELDVESVQTVTDPAAAQQLVDVDENNDPDSLLIEEKLHDDDYVDETALANAAASVPHYPESWFTEDQIRNGGSILYLLGKYLLKTDPSL